MRSVNCAGCGILIPDAKGRRKWCSQKCRRATLYGGRCEICGAPTDGSNGAAAAPTRCLAHSRGLEAARANRRAQRDAKRELIQRRWEEGKLIREIAEELGSPIGSVHVELTRMRRDGWELPLRRAGRRSTLAA